MKIKRNILAGIVTLISLMSYGCGYKEDAAENQTVTESESTDFESTADEEIVFKSAAIEAKTREILGEPDGSITKNGVLYITSFEMEDECAAPFEDLQWFQNLERIELSGCGVQTLNGVEKLTHLKYLSVRNNDISDIEPIQNLTNLKEFDCAYNPINNYSPLGGLDRLEVLHIGGNANTHTDITAISNLNGLTDLYAAECGIDDISALKNLKKLEYLNLRCNQIDDISALAGLDKITYLELGANNISDISPLEGLDTVIKIDLSDNQISDITTLYGLNAMAEINLRDNPISDEELADFYEKKQSEAYFTVTQKGRIREDMPEFTFELTAYWDMERGCYALQSVEVRDGDKALQTISIPELALFDATWIYDSMKATLGFELEDVNFDGYLDIRQFDTPNGNYRQEWIYLVWNPEKYMFEHDARLNDISLAVFDQENKLIYGMERSGAANHYFSTYQYIDGEPVMIEYTTQEGIWLDDGQVKEFCAAASEGAENTDYEGNWCYEHNMELNEATGKLEIVSEEYVFYCYDEETDKECDKFHVAVSSELGQRITQAKEH